MSMNTKSVPSLYRYCMSRLSTVAVSTFVPALNVLSTTLPDRTFFSLVRTKAPPLPGLTCWNSTTARSWPSIFSTVPFFRSLVVATIAASCPVGLCGPRRRGARAADRGRSYRASRRRPDASDQHQPPDGAHQAGPDQGGQRADDEALRGLRVLAQLRVAPEPLDGDDDRDPVRL